MLKCGIKRQRTQRQITDEKAEEAVRQQAIQEKLDKFDEVQQKYRSAKEEAENGKGAVIQLQSLINNGQIHLDENGVCQVVDQSVNHSQMSQHSQQQMNSDIDEQSNGFQI